jgi:hypothetical protein
MSETAADDDLYDLAPPALPVPVAPKAQEPSEPARPAPLPYHGLPAGSSRVDEQTLKNQHIPLWLLGGGVAIEVMAAFLYRRNLQAALRDVGIELILGTAFMLAGILLAAKLRGIQLGSFGTVVLKLSAISVAPSAVVRLATPLFHLIPILWILGWVAQFALYFALLGMLFDLDESDTWYCVLVIFLLRLAVYFLLIGLGLRWG